MNFFNKRKGGLYAAYLAEQERAEKKSVSEYLVKNGQIANADIAVATVMRGRGATHISCSLANFLAETGNRVALVSDDISKQEEERRKRLCKLVDLYTTKESSNLRKDYRLIVRDVGFIPDATGIKIDCTDFIMVCSADEECFRRISKFVDIKGIPEFKYLFNIVPREWKDEALNIMRRYDAEVIGEIFSPRKLPSSVERAFASLLRKT